MAGRDDANLQDGTEKRAPALFPKGSYSINDFQLMECIGEGTFGQVWKAKKGQSFVALKILKTSMTSEETQRELRSLEALQELHHPYLLQTFGFWSDGAQLFIEMEIADGGSLKERLKACQAAGQKGVPADELLKYFAEVAASLDYLHGQRPRRFLHRDIKPANILLVAGSAKLADFGLLRRVTGEHAGTKTQGGTPVFMAPESIKSDIFSVSTDLYSLAVTYAELRQGKLPFTGLTEYQICTNILNSSPELGDDFHPDEKAVLLKALDKDPEQRHASCGEFVAALRQAVPRGTPTDPATSIPSVSQADMGTVPRRSSAAVSTTSAPRLSTDRLPSNDVPTVIAAPQTPTRSLLAPLLTFIALVMVIGVGLGVWFVVNRRDQEVPIIPDPVVRLMEIKTTPAGATVFIDGKKQDKPTNAAFEVPKSAYQLRLVAPDYKEVERNISPEQDKVEITLEKIVPPPIVRTLELKTLPSGAVVYLNGKEQATRTDGVFNVPNAVYHLKVATPGYKEIVRTVEPSQTKLEVVLEKIPLAPIVRKLEIKTTPPGATVYINDKKQNAKTNGTFVVPDVPYKLRLAVVGHKEVERSIDPSQEKIALTLEKIPPPPVRTFALLVGGHQPTKHLPDFLHAEPDVVELGRVLVAGGYPAEHVQVLTQKATADRIRETLTNLAKECTVSDTLVLAFVGHVVSFPGDRDSYYCPDGCDLNDKSTLVSFTEIYGELKQCPARAKLVLLDGWRTDHVAPPALPDGIDLGRDRAKELPTPAGVTTLASCSADERGNEHALLRHGLFFHAVIRALQGAAEVGPNRQIALDVLASYAAKHVADDAQRDYKRRQVPQLLGHEESKEPIRFAHTDVLNHVNEGLLALEKKEYDRGLAAFNAAEAKNPAYVNIYTGRALCHYFKGKDDLNQYQLAVQECQRALKLDPRDITAISYLAQIASSKARQLVPLAERNQEFQRALDSHDREIQYEPQWGMAYNTRGVTHAMRREYTLAIKDYTEAIRLNPKLKFPYENRGFAYTTQKEYEKAIKDFDKAIEISPASPLNYSRRGSVYRILGKIEPAVDDLNKAVELDPNNPNFLYSRGLVYIEAKNYDSAIEDFTDALRRQEDKETYLGRGFAYNEKGVKDKDSEMYDRAIEDLSKAIKLSPKYVTALYVRGVAYQNKARQAKNDEKLIDLAIQDFNLTIELAPTHAKAWYNRGLAFQAKGQKARGEADIKKAREIDPKVGPSPGGPDS